MSWLLYDPFSFRVLFIGTGLLLFLLAFFLFRLTRDSKPVRKGSPAQPRPPAVSTTDERAVPATPSVPPPVVAPPRLSVPAPVVVPPRPSVPVPAVAPPPPTPQPVARQAGAVPATPASVLPAVAAVAAEAPLGAGYSFRTLQTRSSFTFDLLRAGLIVASFAVLIALIIVSAPESTINGLAARLQPAPTAATTEKLALLYLGDEAKEAEFRIRGVVRNISGDSVEKIDATIRLYSHDSVLLETHIARLDVELIPADAAAQFQLVIPNYTGQIGSYAVEFRTRQQGDPVPFQDVRAMQSQN